MLEYAVFLIEILARLHHADALRAVERGHFHDQHGSDNRILIADIGACEIAVAFLEAKEIAVLLALCLKHTDLLADELEARQHINDLHAESLCDRLDKVCGNDCLDNDRILRHGTELCALLADILKEHCTDLIAGEQCIAAVSVRHGNADSVAVRIGCEQQVRLDLIAETQAAFKGLTDLRIRIGACGEVAVRQLLLLDDGDILDADALEDLANRLIARAVERSIDDLQVALRANIGMDALCEHVFIEIFDDILPDIGDHAGLDGFLKIAGFYIIEHIQRIDLADDSICDIQRDLAAVGAVGLIAVVLCRIVAGRHHDTRRAAQCTDRKGEHRGRHQLGVDMHLDAVCSEHGSGSLCECIGLDTAVVGDCDARCLKGLLDIISKALRCAANGIDIHSVGTGAEYAAETARSECEILIEALTDCFVVAADLFEFGYKIRILCCVLTPEAVQFIFFCHIGLHGTSFLSLCAAYPSPRCAIIFTHIIIIAYFARFAKGQNTEF